MVVPSSVKQVNSVKLGFNHCCTCIHKEQIPQDRSMALSLMQNLKLCLLVQNNINFDLNDSSSVSSTLVSILFL